MAGLSMDIKTVLWDCELVKSMIPASSSKENAYGSNGKSISTP